MDVGRLGDAVIAVVPGFEVVATHAGPALRVTEHKAELPSVGLHPLACCGRAGPIGIAPRIPAALALEVDREPKLVLGMARAGCESERLFQAIFRDPFLERPGLACVTAISARDRNRGVC